MVLGRGDRPKRGTAPVFSYSLDGLLANEGTESWRFCFGVPENGEPDDAAHLDFLRIAYAHALAAMPTRASAGP